MNPETIERNYQALRRLGLTDSRIAANANLLGRDPETVKRNYEGHVGLLGQDYTNRKSGRDFLLIYANLLGIPTETIEANVQFLSSHDINYSNGFLLGTTPKLKRKKMSWLLREIFNYNLEADVSEKRETIYKMRQFIRENPNVLIYSINTLERKREKLREKLS